MDAAALLNAHQHKLHHLAQFLAAFGASYLPAAEDHSESSLTWNIANSSLVSQKFEDVSMELEYPGLMLYMIKNGERVAFDPLGAPLSEIEGWIRETLSSLGIDPSRYNTEMGFTPTSPEDVFVSLDNNDEKILLQLTEERNIAQKALETFRDSAEEACSPIRVWPHHFDTGMLVYPDKNNKKKGMGMGYAPADRVSGTPYFYAYARSDQEIDYENLPKLENGKWHINNWKGALIPVDQAIDLKMINLFYRNFAGIMKDRI